MNPAEQARAAYAAKSGQYPDFWNIVTDPEIGVWYDFYDLETGKCGQCLKIAGGAWHQKPLGISPTILDYLDLAERRRVTRLKKKEA